MFRDRNIKSFDKRGKVNVVNEFLPIVIEYIVEFIQRGTFNKFISGIENMSSNRLVLRKLNIFSSATKREIHVLMIL